MILRAPVYAGAFFIEEALMTKKHLSFRKTDILIPAAALILSGAVALYAFFSVSSGVKGSTVIVTVEGTEYARFPLDEERDIIISGKNGLNNHLVIKNGEADITGADCPDKLCVHQKKISRNGETIVCLPNRVVIEIKGEDEGSVDTVAR